MTDDVGVETKQTNGSNWSGWVARHWPMLVTAVVVTASVAVSQQTIKRNTEAITELSRTRTTAIANLRDELLERTTLYGRPIAEEVRSVREGLNTHQLYGHSTSAPVTNR